MRVNHRENELENHDRGLDYDLPKLLHRRGMLKLVAGASVVALAGCATAQTRPRTPPPLRPTDPPAEPGRAARPRRGRQWRGQQPRGVGRRDTGGDGRSLPRRRIQRRQRADRERRGTQ